jgi:cell division protein FtsB
MGHGRNRQKRVVLSSKVRYLGQTVPRRTSPRARRPTRTPKPDRARGGARGRRVVQGFLYVAAFTLVVEALVGTRGLPALLQARQDHVALTQALDQLKAENRRLRDEAARLSHDPAAIEELAREELRMLSPGEKLFILRDATPSN